MPNGISCEPSGLCPQRLMARLLGRTDVLPRYDGKGEGGSDLYCDGKVYILIGIAQIVEKPRDTQISIG